ncbi:MAG: hypothetical protein R2715_09900 [Ilumatobacteraceae bacterium]
MQPVVFCDLDGVVWLDRRPIPGSVEAIARLRAAGHRVLFVTNNSMALVAEHEGALAAIGIPAEGDVLSSSMAAATLVEPGRRVLVGGGPGVMEAFERRGAVAVNAADLEPGSDLDGYDAVAIGLHRDFDYPRLTLLATAVRRGATLIGTNADSTFPTPDGPVPGGRSDPCCRGGQASRRWSPGNPTGRCCLARTAIGGDADPRLRDGRG